MKDSTDPHPSPPSAALDHNPGRHDGKLRPDHIEPARAALAWAADRAVRVGSYERRSIGAS